LYLKDGVKSFHKEGNGVNVELKSEKRVSADVVILAIGVKPDIDEALVGPEEINNATGKGTHKDYARKRLA